MNRAVARCIPVLALVCALAAPAWAGAATKYDTSYQNGGTLLLPQVRGIYGQIAQGCEVAGKNLSIAGRFGYNSPGNAQIWTRTQRLGITSVKLHPRQPMTLGVADVAWRMQRIPTDHVVLDQDFADDGSFAYVTRSARKGQRSRLKLFRIDAAGNRIKSFGHNGYISITVPGLDGLVRVIALPGRKVLLLAEAGDTQVLLRYTRSGRPDATWGNSGVVELAAPQYPYTTPVRALDTATITSRGGLVIAASNAPGKPAAAYTGLIKLTAAGRLDTNWAAGGFWSPPVPKTLASNGKPYSGPTQTLITTLRKGGDFAVLYGDSVKEDLGILSDLKLAYVDQDSGVTTLFNEKAGHYYLGGDTGFPDSNPWILATSSAGPIVAHAEGRYSSPGGTFLGEAIRFSPDADQPVASAKISNSGFATGDFAVDPAAKYLYFCGAFGTTSKNARDKLKREQRKSVAVKRVAL